MGAVGVNPAFQDVSASDEKPLVRIGLVSDVQYADHEDGLSFHGVPRFYRSSLQGLQRCVGTWKQAQVAFGINLGDTVDGLQREAPDGQDPRARSLEGLERVCDVFQALQLPVHHLLGNHCFYNLDRPTLNKWMHIVCPDGEASYYSMSVGSRWRLLFLDTYDISVLGWPSTHPRHQAAEQLLARNNTNSNKNMSDGLAAGERHWVAYGGGIGEGQLAWLQAELQTSRDEGQLVLVFAHVPLAPGCAPASCLIWNHEQVCGELRASGNVLATFCGHAHQNGYVLDSAGVHHVVLPSILETPPGRDAFAVLDLFESSAELRGVDCCLSLSLTFPARAATALATIAA